MIADPLSKNGRAIGGGTVSPVRVLMIVLVVVFAVESLIMLVLLAMPRAVRLEAFVSFIDAALLTVVLFPVLWRLVVRPLRSLVADRGRLLARLLEIQEQERGRLARELHDELGQIQTAILLGLKAVTSALTLDEAHERASALHGLAVSAVDSTRRMARVLSPSVLVDFGLAKALERLCEDLSAAAGVQVIFDTELGPARFGSAAEIAAYRVAQEATTNALKHSGAAQVHVELRCIQNELRLVVRDNGRGFNEQAAANAERASGGLGLSGMRERVVLLGGRFAIHTEVGAGTTVEAVIPTGRQAT